MKDNKGYIIAIIKKESQPEPVEFRVFYNGQIKDIPYEILYNAMINSDCIDNAEIKDAKIIGSNGSLEGYGIVGARGKIKRNAFVIVKKYGLTADTKRLKRVVFRVVDVTGKPEICASDVVVKYIEKLELANGKIVYEGDIKLISAITGEYPYEEITEDLLCKDHRVKEYISTLELLQKQLESAEARKDTYEKEVEILTVVPENMESLISESSERFNSGLTSSLNKREIDYTIQRKHLDARYGEAVKIDIVKYSFKIDGEDCFIYQGHALIKMKIKAKYQWSLVDYAQNEFGEIIYNNSFSYSITDTILSKLNIAAQEFEDAILTGSEMLGESKTMLLAD